MLDSQISKYVAVRRNRGEQMKAIVPASAKRFAVSERTVWVAIGGNRLEDQRNSAHVGARMGKLPSARLLCE